MLKLTEQLCHTQFALMMWRNFLIKRKKVDEIVKGWILPLLVFAVLWLLYLEFPDVIGTVRTVEEKVRTFEDDSMYENIPINDDLFGGGDDDFMYTTIQRKVLDISLNSYLEQVGVPIAFLQLQWSLITLIVLERENRVKEMMLLMGLQEWAYWTSMFLTELITSVILCLLLGYVSTIWGLFHSGLFLDIFILLTLYSLASISFLYCVSTFFKSPHSAGQVTSIALLLSIIIFLAGRMETLSSEWQLVASLIPSIAIQYGILSFFPANSDLGMKVCVDECPNDYYYCRHSLGCAADTFGDHRKISKRDFCDRDVDCCGDWLCDNAAAGPCVIHIHQINCLTQEEFDEKTLPFASVCLVLSFDCVLFALLTALLVWTGWNFEWFLSRSVSSVVNFLAKLRQWRRPKYIRVSSDEVNQEVLLGYLEEDVKGGQDFEGEDQEARCHPLGYVEDRSPSERASVRVVGLSKSFQRQQTLKDRALDRCCLEMREGELTVLLGQNGAGKTTLISCLIGTLEADSGRASVLGFNALDVVERDMIRSSIGICPQEDALFEGFTPREMLTFYACLKQVPWTEVDSCVNKMLSEMGLLDAPIVKHADDAIREESMVLKRGERLVADMDVNDLSGGQMRRVSIGIALVGNSKLVVLDEPTSAMDPVGKHQVWTLLRRMRAHRTILLTTHLMDEADAVADRVAIMAKGQVHCCGAPGFLKRNLGEGYTLTLARTKPQEKSSRPQTTWHEISCWVFGHIGPRTQLEDPDKEDFSQIRTSSNSVCFTLPFSINASKFFGELDQYLREHNIWGEIVYGVEMPSLESVFLTVTTNALKHHDNCSQQSTSRLEAPRTFGKSSGLKEREFEDEEEESWKRFIRQCRAIIWFRLDVSLRGQPLTTLGLVLPSSLAFAGGAAVLGAMHSLATEGRCAVVAAMVLSGVFVPGMFASSLLLEREKGLRHLLTVSGCGVQSFWVGTWIADMITSQAPPILALCIVTHVYEVDGWVWHPLFYLTCVVFLLHQALLGSILSFAFNSSNTASLFGPGMILAVSILLPTLIVLGLVKTVPMHLTAGLPFDRGGTLVYVVATCSPHFMLWVALISLGAPIDTNPKPSASIAILMQLTSATLMIAYIYYRDSVLTAPTFPKGRAATAVLGQKEVDDALEEGEEDEDVVRERARAADNSNDQDFLRIINLRKEFRDNNGHTNVAVKSISLVAQQGQCIGLLGPNGAGKSTTIAMLSRALVPTEGDAVICGESVLTRAPQALRNLGLVPQDMNTLWAFGSVNAHLRLFANLRPCPVARTRVAEDEAVVNILRSMDLSEQASKNAGALSGGMKRRLSTAVGLIGSPRVVVLDEPTAGLDPLSRRHVWRSLLNAMSGDKLALLLTTHSLEEAEVLCHRLGIVVKGALKCIGSPIHLKTKFGRGYEVTVLFGEQEAGEDILGASFVQKRVTAAISRLTSLFNSCLVLERSDNRCRLLISKLDMDLPRCFEVLDEITNHDSEVLPPTTRSFYCVNLSSIEQVFLDVVAKESEES